MKQSIKHSQATAYPTAKIWASMLFAIIAALAVTSCNSVADQIEEKLKTLVAEDGTEIEYRTDILAEFPTDIFEPIYPTPANLENARMAKGYTAVRENQRWTRARLGEWCKDLGLKPGAVYFVKQMTYFQLIVETKDSLVLPYVPKETKIGLVEYLEEPFRQGFTPGNYMTADGKLAGNYSTILFFIGYDDKGKAVGKYFPCTPDELEWHYSLIPYSDTANTKSASRNGD